MTEAMQNTAYLFGGPVAGKLVRRATGKVVVTVGGHSIQPKHMYGAVNFFLTLHIVCCVGCLLWRMFLGQSLVRVLLLTKPSVNDRSHAECCLFVWGEIAHKLFKDIGQCVTFLVQIVILGENEDA